jgi:hypothetical protein
MILLEGNVSVAQSGNSWQVAKLFLMILLEGSIVVLRG